jgi:hypothetical protein
MSFPPILFGNGQSDKSKSTENKPPLSEGQQFWLNYRKQSAAQGAPFPDYPVATNDDQFVRQNPPDQASAEQTAPETTGPDQTNSGTVTPQLTGAETNLPALPPAAEVGSAEPADPTQPAGQAKMDMTPLLTFIGGLPDEALAKTIIEPILKTRLSEDELKTINLGETPFTLPFTPDSPEKALDLTLLLRAVETLKQHDKLGLVDLSPAKDKTEKATLTATRENFLKQIASLYSANNIDELLNKLPHLMQVAPDSRSPEASQATPETGLSKVTTPAESSPVPSTQAQIDMTPLLTFIGGLPDEALAKTIIEPILKTAYSPETLSKLDLNALSATPFDNPSEHKADDALRTILLDFAVGALKHRGKLDVVNLTPPKDDADKKAFITTQDALLKDIKTLFVSQAAQNPPPVESAQPETSAETTPENPAPTPDGNSEKHEK